MSDKVLVSPNKLSDMMRTEPVVLIDTRDPAIYAEAHIPGAVDVREIFTYLATSTPRVWRRFATNSPKRSGRRVCPARKPRSSTSNR